MGYHYGPSADLLVLECVREPPGPNSQPFEDTLSAGSAAILCTGGLDVIRKEAWSFYRTISGVRPLGPLGPLGFECSQHGQTLRPSVVGIRSKAQRPFGVQ